MRPIRYWASDTGFDHLFFVALVGVSALYTATVFGRRSPLSAPCLSAACGQLRFGPPGD